MTVLVSGVGLLACSFLVQLVLWRLALPRRHTHALLVLFAFVPLVVTGAVWASGHAPELSAAEGARVALFYVSFSLAYIVLYSAIENQSPTLAIVSHVAKAGAAGCADAELFDRFGRGSTIAERLAVMEHGGWVRSDGDRLRLTPQGGSVARFFELAARIVGITKGG